MHCLKANIKQIPRKTEQKEKENMNAVEALDENLIKQNEIENRIQLIVFSCYNEKAEKDSKKSGYFYSFYALCGRIDCYCSDWYCCLSGGR